ncbi:amidohydrolase family protein [Desulfohalovibrio reitneri]|uniref:amidohydrolase family protein n=1 Tax=Desulfohalovibrio reitneri TaxID=1307759 RepID=UPI00110D5F7E
MQKPCDLLVTADVVLTQDAERRVLRDGAVAVAFGSVMAAGPAREIEAAFRPAERLDLGRSLLLPGLVNCHAHSPMTLLRGLADDLPLMEWLENHIFPVEAALTEDLVETGAAWGCLEMLASGVTCFCDGYLHTPGVRRAVDATGIRAVVGEGVFSFPTSACPDWRAALDLTREQAGAWRDHPRVRTSVLPHSAYLASPEILEACVETARDLGLLLHTHAAESTDETAQVVERLGVRPLEVLRRAGALGEGTLLAHCVDITDEEIDLLAGTGVAVAHCPQSNMKLASGAARVADMLAAGVTVGLGTDGPASNNDHDLFQEMTSAALLAKAVSRDPTLLPAEAVLDMATRRAAECVGWPELGAIEPGRAADMCALDLDAPSLMPLYNPVSHCVYAATAGEVVMTMVDGRVVYRDGVFPHLDAEALREDMEEAASWARGKVV